MLAYKYAPPERIDILKNGTIRFTQASTLNDPFEAYPNSDSLRQSLIERTYQDRIRPVIYQYPDHIIRFLVHLRCGARVAVDEVIDRSRNNYGILSLSENRSELLMWSHYCKSHQGFVIGFDIDHDYFQTSIFERKSKLVSVAYSNSRPTMPRFELTASINTAQIIHFSKSSHWSYEKEWRMIASLKYADDTQTKPDGEKIHLFRFPIECVKEVIRGCKMSAEKKAEIKGLVAANYPSAKLYQATQSRTKFDLDIVEVPL